MLCHFSSVAQASQLFFNGCGCAGSREKVCDQIVLLGDLQGPKYLTSCITVRDFSWGSNDTMFGVVFIDPLLSRLLVPIDSPSCNGFMMSVPL